MRCRSSLDHPGQLNATPKASRLALTLLLLSSPRNDERDTHIGDDAAFNSLIMDSCFWAFIGALLADGNPCITHHDLWEGGWGNYNDVR